MMGNRNCFGILISISQLSISHWMQHFLIVIQEEYIMISVKSTALPFIAHKHWPAFFILLFYNLADFLPVLFNCLSGINILQRSTRLISPHIHGIIGNRPEIHHLPGMITPFSQLFHLIVMNIAVKIRPEFF